ncbi:hypothetical protein OYC61_013870 [Alcaligenes nematophilus]|uniref:SMODS-associated NUDIX domain-containing protein n=1 Tax=Alcaligenes nematophilus TaxID=2994643 RepID=A0ABU3MUZ0_9BURK|nr:MULTISPECIES: hypothetical protein [Alcaligenes]MCR4144255.1 hypothetical protein [Alcaligenes faecalis]MDT8505387.1 hypothetical protein [Alcaligenes nematophilus]MDT8527160.1 hypothetical protein [Alcaligenes nematophilus]
MGKENNEISLGKSIDDDKGLLASRRLLMTLAILLLASSVGGVTIKEANTFIFKLEILNPSNLSLLLAISVAISTLRYYSYAFYYHKKIQDIWIKKLMSDTEIFHISYNQERIDGVLGNKLDIYPQEYPGLADIKYIPKAFFLRSLSFTVFGRDDGYDGPEDYEYQENHSLNEFNKKWKFRHLLKLIKIESTHRFKTMCENREYLDITFPYLTSITSISIYIYLSIIQNIAN